jgi:hypothetical protein
MTARATMCVAKGVPVLVELVARVSTVLKMAIVAMQYSNTPTLHRYLPTRAILPAELEALISDAMSRKSKLDIYGLTPLPSEYENLVFTKRTWSQLRPILRFSRTPSWPLGSAWPAASLCIHFTPPRRCCTRNLGASRTSRTIAFEPVCFPRERRCCAPSCSKRPKATRRPPWQPTRRRPTRKRPQR